jgi:hypothetical protein
MGDVLLFQKLCLEGDERNTLRIANDQGPQFGNEQAMDEPRWVDEAGGVPTVRPGYRHEPHHLGMTQLMIAEVAAEQRRLRDEHIHEEYLRLREYARATNVMRWPF